MPHTNLDLALLAAGRELTDAEHKHPQWPTDLLRQVAIVAEELGEAQKEALSLVEWQERGCGTAELAARGAALDREMAQVAAMALRFLAARL